MAWSLVTSTWQGSSGGANVTTSAINTTGVDLIVVGMSVAISGGYASASISDNYGNTWVLAASNPHFAYSGDNGSKLYYCSNPAVGSGHTFSSSGGGLASLIVTAWSGSASSPLDQTSISAASWGPDFDLDDVTPTANNALCITHIFDCNGTPTINQGYTVHTYYSASGGNYYGGALAYLTQTTAAVTGPVWQTGALSAATLATFKMASGGGGVSAQLSATEGADTSAISGTVAAAGISARLLTTEAADTAIIRAGQTGTALLVATEAADTAAIAGGTVAWVARLAATETADTAAIAGVTVVWPARLVATETSDIVAISAGQTGTAQLVATEAADTAVISGAVVGAPIDTQLTATEGADTAAISGNVVAAAATAQLAATEAADIAAITASVQAWSLVGVGSSGVITTASHTLTMPAGVALGDLLIAIISSRIVSSTPVTLPTGGEWTLIGQQNNNNILQTSAALPSGTMAYCIRGASNPNLTFTHPVAPDVAIGQILAYRGVDTTTPLNVQSAVTTATAITSVVVSGVTTTTNDALLIVAACGGQEGNWSAFDAVTDPNIASSGTPNTTTPPTANTWLLRSNGNTTTGSDVSLGVADAVKAGAGATGSISCTSSLTAGHVIIIGGFKPADLAAGISVRLAATEAADTAVITAQGGVVVQLAAIEATDTAAIAGGTVTWFGKVEATEAADIAAISANTGDTARLAATEAADTAAISGGTVTWLARLDATEAADVSVIRANIVGSALLVATEAADAAAIRAEVVGAGIGALLAATEGADTAAISAAVTGVAGKLSATEASDAAALSALVAWPAQLVAIEAADTAAITIAASHTARLVAIEAADTAAISGTVVIVGIAVQLAATEAADTAAISAQGGIVVQLAATEAGDTASLFPVVLSVVTAAVAATEGADTAAVTAAVTGVAGRIAATEAGDTAALTGLVQNTVAGRLIAIETPDVAAIRVLASAFGRLVAVEGQDTARFSSAKINQQSPGFIARQTPKPNFIARDDAAPDLVARRNATPNINAGP